MRYPRLVALLAATSGLVVEAAAQPSTDAMTPHTFESKQHGVLPYRLFRPEATGGATFPLVLFLHGAGERGSDNTAQLRHGVREFLAPRRQTQRPCFVAAPQCPPGVWWNVDLLLELSAALIALPGVDPDRCYVTGLSMGGYATWHLIGRRPDLFAAAVPVCGGGELAHAPALATVPIWAFHGAADRTVPVARSREMVAAIRAAGGQPRYTEYPRVGHDSWTRTYADQAMHEWLFAQERPRPLLRDGDRVVFLGDSITAAGASGNGYIRVLEAELRALQPAPRVELLGAGVSGNRVPDLLARLERDVLQAKPTLVVVYIGINDVWHSLQGRGTPREEYEAGLRTLLQRLARAEVRAILCTPSVIGEKTDGSNELDARLDEYADSTRRVAGDTGVPVVDLRERFLAFLRANNAANAGQGVLTTDGVHLNDAGNRLVAECLRDALLR